jgi:hypothetical protein
METSSYVQDDGRHVAESKIFILSGVLCWYVNSTGCVMRLIISSSVVIHSLRGLRLFSGLPWLGFQKIQGFFIAMTSRPNLRPTITPFEFPLLFVRAKLAVSWNWPAPSLRCKCLKLHFDGSVNGMCMLNRSSCVLLAHSPQKLQEMFLFVLPCPSLSLCGGNNSRTIKRMFTTFEIGEFY